MSVSFLGCLVGFSGLSDTWFFQDLDVWFFSGSLDVVFGYCLGSSVRIGSFSFADTKMLKL